MRARIFTNRKVPIGDQDADVLHASAPGALVPHAVHEHVWVPGPNGYTIFTADYVDTVEGTGLVHQAPYGDKSGYLETGKLRSLGSES